MRILFSTVLVFIIIACQFQPTEPANQNKFVTEYISGDGLYYRMETEKEYYTLNEKIDAHLLIVNLSQDTIKYEEDSLNFDFWLRNRISRNLVYSIDSTIVDIIQDEQTVASLAIDSGNGILQLPAKSDSKVYTLRLTKDDPPFAGVEGFFKILLTIYTADKQISASVSTFINLN